MADTLVERLAKIYCENAEASDWREISGAERDSMRALIRLALTALASDERAIEVMAAAYLKCRAERPASSTMADRMRAAVTALVEGQ